MIPPCSKTLLNKIKRCNLVCGVLKNAKSQLIPKWDIIRSGWTFENGRLDVNWYDGDQYPPTLNSNILEDNFEVDEHETEDDEEIVGDDIEEEIEDLDQE